MIICIQLTNYVVLGAYSMEVMESYIKSFEGLEPYDGITERTLLHSLTANN